MSAWLDENFLGYPILDYVLSAAILIGSFLFLKFGLNFIEHLIIKIADGKSINAPIQKSFRRIKKSVMIFIAFYIAIQRFDVPERADKISEVLFYLIVTVQILIIVNVWVRFAWEESPLTRNPNSHLKTLKGSLASVSILIVWVGVFLFLLDNFGFNVATVLAGLGVGGIAIGLALQSVVGDLIASLVIGLDRPFEVGDFIVLDDYKGTVEHVGIKTTRLRSLSGEQLVIPNSSMVSSRIRNFKRMQERRVTLNVGVTYDTPQTKLERIPSIIKSIVQSKDHTRFDRAHFSEFGESSLNFEVVYFTLSPDYNMFMDIQQSINHEIRRQFIAEEIQFAFPTRTIDMPFEVKELFEGQRTPSPQS